MTESKAKTMLEAYMECDRIKNNVDHEKQCHEDCDNCKLCYAQGTVGEHREAMNMAIKALEKQIQKKPNLEGDGYADGQLVYDTWICPCCEKHYEVDYDDYDFCPNCGQAIDWSDDD